MQVAMTHYRENQSSPTNKKGGTVEADNNRGHGLCVTTQQVISHILFILRKANGSGGGGGVQCGSDATSKRGCQDTDKAYLNNCRGYRSNMGLHVVHGHLNRVRRRLNTPIFDVSFHDMALMLL